MILERAGEFTRSVKNLKIVYETSCFNDDVSFVISKQKEPLMLGVLKLSE